MKLTRLIMINHFLTRAGGWNNLECDAVVGEICNARADVRAAVDLDRALTTYGLCAAIDSVLPRKERIFDSEAKMDIARICRCLRVTALSGAS